MFPLMFCLVPLGVLSFLEWRRHMPRVCVEVDEVDEKNEKEHMKYEMPA